MEPIKALQELSPRSVFFLKAVAVETELLVKVASGGAAQTVRDVVELQKSIKQLGKETKDTEALAKALGKAFNLPEGDVEDLAKALAQAKEEADGLANSTKGLDDIFQGLLQGIGQGLTQLAFDGLKAALDAIVGTIGQAIQEFEAFEAGLTAVEAKTGATAEDLERLGDQAKDLAAVTSQTPAGITELSSSLISLGATLEDVEANLEGVTKLADVLGEDPVLTGQIVQTGLNIFGEFGETSDSLTDKISALINTTAAGSTGGVAEFFQLFQDAGSIAASAGVSFDELSAAFATLRDGGTSASVASTGLKTVLLSLASPSTEAAKELDRLNINVFDANGNFVGLQEAVQRFAKDDYSGTESQQEQLDLATTIFGREGAPAIISLLGEIDGKYQTTLGNVQNATGTVDETLEILNQSLERQAQLLEGNISSALTTFGQALGPVRGAVLQFANDLLSATLDASNGFDRLQAAGERFAATLDENPTIVRRLADAFAQLLDSSLDQLANFTDAFADFLANDQNVDDFADSIESIGTVITIAGETVAFLVRLTNGIQQLKGVIEDIPVVGEILSNVFEGPIGAITDLLRNIQFIIDKLNEFREEATARLTPILEPIQAIIDGIIELRSQVLQTLGIIGQFPGAIEAGFDTSGALGQIRTLAEGYDGLRDVTGQVVDLSIADAAAQQSATDAAADRAELAEAAAEAAKEEADALKQIREDDKREATEDFDDAALARQRAEDERSRQAEQDFEDRQRSLEQAFEDRQRADESAFQQRQQSDQEAFEAGQQAKAKTFQENQQAAADQFRQQQEAQTLAFQDDLEARRNRGNSELDALASEVERRVALANADSAEERRQLQETFDAEREAAEQRRRIEQNVLNDRRSVVNEADSFGELDLSPLEQARADFESELQSLQEAFQEEQQAAQLAFEDEQQARAEAFDANQQAAEQAFQAAQQADAEAFAETQREDQRVFEETQRDAERAFEDEQRTIQQAFEDAERDRRRAFNDEQRALDRANAAEIANLLQQARDLESGDLDIDDIPARRDGGPVRAGQPYLVGEAGPELITPSRNGYVHTAAETLKLLGRMPTAQPPAIASIQNTGTIERELAAIKKLLKNRPIVQPGGNTYNLNTDSPAQDAISLATQNMRDLIEVNRLG